MNTEIQEIINEYRKSIPQSEQEIRSKWIVPLLDVLGYPSEYRAEEFPVYGYAGREELKAKYADFLLFDNKEFGSYKGNNQREKMWVEDHSLLIVEAKSPGKIIDDTGQARFYNYWSKAVGYIMTDGEVLRGFIQNPNASDFMIIDSVVDNLAYEEGFWCFSYDNILSIKENAIARKSGFALDEEVQYIINDEELILPEVLLDTMRDALGRNAAGLTNVKLVATFMNTTKFLLENDLRYDVPRYILDFPRNNYDSQLFVDGSPGPVFEGVLTEYYWENIDRYLFENRSLEILVEISEGDRIQSEITVHVLDESVDERIRNLNKIKQIDNAKHLYIRMMAGKTLHIPLEQSNRDNKKKKQFVASHDIWIESLRKLQCIESYYGLQFKLEHIEGQEELENYYSTLEFIYTGTMMKQNCVLTGPKIEKDIPIVEEPIMIDEIPEEKAETLVLHGVVFAKFRYYVLPGKIKKKGNWNKKIIEIPVCCECRVVNLSE